ncbi:MULTISPECIES: YraN family protein [Rhodobacterales]|uniref:YraN family protein n=1 Tax=Halocynthiibacter styelae TaxID=2761955 RepID=A0A8J7IYJ5_9RHOB|nr:MULTISPECIES: YraN family protein [Rhodobacterales]MBI1494620.1 YraN family protein [Paenihalocynthiibacter styelae]
MTDKAAKGRTAYYAGLAAEDQVAKHYTRLGAEVLDTRWRGEGGEIDLILRLAGITIFVEVKKSRDMTSAADMLSATQVTRIMVAAGEYMAVKGLMGDMRVDAALVDQQGAIEVIENITLDF